MSAETLQQKIVNLKNSFVLMGEAFAALAEEMGQQSLQVPLATIAPPVSQVGGTIPVPAQPTVVPAQPPVVLGSGTVSSVNAPLPVSKVAAPPGMPRRPLGPPVVPKPAAPAVAPAPVIANRQPARELNDHETITELNNFADTVARDKDHVNSAPPAEPAGTPNIHGVVATDDDLPENLRAGYVEPAPTQVIPAAPVQVVAAPIAPAAVTAAAQIGATTQGELKAFIERAGKVVKGKLAVEKNAGAIMKEYLLRKSGQKELKFIPAPVFETLISATEQAVDAAATMAILKS